MSAATPKVSRLSQKIDTQMARARHAGLLRQRRALAIAKAGDKTPNEFMLAGVSFINFSSNDYLGLSQASVLVEAMSQGSQLYGVGSGASPLVTGYSEAHRQLEQALCEASGHEAALLFCSGFSANTALMKTLFDRHDTVVADKLIHASLIDGLRDSGAHLKRFAHNDIDAAVKLIATHQPQAVITESVFSMDGDCAPLGALYQACQQAQSWLIVDDAHGFGVLPVAKQPRASVSNCDVQVVTFGKALGCQGAAILGSQACIDFMVANARHYIYSTALSPANAYVAYRAVKWLGESTKIADTLHGIIDAFRRQCQQAGITLSDSVTPIQPIVIGELERLQAVTDGLKARGIWVGSIRPPTVPKGSARLRITLNVNHTQAQLDHLIASLVEVL